MSISSLGVGSGILTQDVLDQLRAADESTIINPIKLSLANENDKKNALKLIDATMTNLIDSINEIKSQSLYDERKTTVVGSSIDVVAAANSDVQDFTLEVTQLATKKIEQSGSFTDLLGEDYLVASGAGSLNLNINGADYTINYDATTTLKDLKNEINNVAGADVDATLLNIGAGDVRLVISSANTGSTQDITITDTSANLTALSSTNIVGVGMADIQVAQDAKFKFNGSATEIVRSSNKVDDLITGLTITLKEVNIVGQSSSASIAQDRENIESKFDSFVEKYNSAMTELGKMTKPSTDSAERGIFSGESTIKSMKGTLQDIIGTIGGGVGLMGDYGFDIDKAGKMSIDKTIFNNKLDNSTSNTEIFFSGGDYDNGDATTTTVDGAFTELSAFVEGYTKYNATLDQFKDSISSTITSLEDRQANSVERLDSKYAILKKQFTAYDLLINRINSASNMFVQLANAQTSNN